MRLTDRQFKWVPSGSTDVRRTWRRFGWPGINREGQKMNLEQRIHTGVTMNDYILDSIRDVPTLNASTAHTLITRSPFHAYWQHPRLNKHYEREESKVADIGTVAHALLLESSERNVVIIDAPDFRTKWAREERDGAYADGKTPVLKDRIESCRAMAKVAREFVAGSQIGGVFLAGQPEPTLVWQDEGVWCRARPDWLNEHWCVHYKTSASAEPNGWIRWQLTGGYDIAHQFYERGLRAVGKTEVQSVFLIQEVDAPFACSLVGLSPAYADLANRKVERALKLWQHCLAMDQWPAYPRDICFADPASWHLAEFEAMEQMDPLQAVQGLQP